MRNEIVLTNRLGRLPDAYSLTENRFLRKELSLPQIIFGASEYAKDGLLPLTEVLGHGVWLSRMKEIVEDIFAHAPIETNFGRLPASDTEVNGEMLQVLVRLFAITRERRYLDWAKRIGDAYCLEVLPRNNFLPAHQWDFAQHRAVRDILNLNDHGNEIIGGLSELFLITKHFDPETATLYETPLRKMFDTLLEKARNKDGLWFSLVQPSTLKVLQYSTPDTWGYTLSSVYTFGLATGDEKYYTAVEKALSNLNQPAYYDWGGADGFADSIESALLLLSKRSISEGWAWLEIVEPRFLARQREDGIIEGWHGDGNYIRTALMLALYHTQGTYLIPWDEGIYLGAVQSQNSLYVFLRAKQDWKGLLRFDYPRHREVMGLPIDYPRLNSFPEWFTVEATNVYQIEAKKGGKIIEKPPTGIWLGEELRFGVQLFLKSGEKLYLQVTRRKS
ncbi:MAG: glycoside hydrolase family 127 protein [Armatimonadetes bacterium]|nr:glycoside hydrolase family 127 protein [Armatimonadota bacterium]